MKTLSLLFFISTLLIAAGPSYAAEEDWVFIQERQGVTIHSRKVAGHAESEFKGTRIISQPVEVVGAVLDGFFLGGWTSEYTDREGKPSKPDRGDEVRVSAAGPACHRRGRLPRFFYARERHPLKLL